MNDSWPREPQGRELENLTQLFKVLGAPSRMKVLFQIGSSEACVTEVAAGSICQSLLFLTISKFYA